MTLELRDLWEIAGNIVDDNNYLSGQPVVIVAMTHDDWSVLYNFWIDGRDMFDSEEE